MCNHSKPASGFTLLELIVTISIAGVLMALAIPSFSDLIRNNRLTTYANELVTSLNIARSEAVKRGASVSVRKIGGNWNTSGWNVFVDTDADGILDTGEEVLKIYPALPATFTLVGNTPFADFILYEPDGTSSHPIGGSFAICDNSDGNNQAEPYTSRLIIVNSVGRIQMGKDANKDGRPEKNDGTPLTDCTAP